MKKGSVFANKKGPLSTGYGTPVNISSTSASFFDNSLQQIPHNPLGGSSRNWQATPLSSHRFPPPHYQSQQPNSTSSIRAHPMVASAMISNTPNSSMINRVKPYTLQSLVENLNEVRKICLLIIIFFLLLSYSLNLLFLIRCVMIQNMVLKIFLLYLMYVFYDFLEFYLLNIIF
jgi:hypothetical protein